MTTYYVVANNPVAHKTSVAYVCEFTVNSHAELDDECKRKFGNDTKYYYGESKGKLEKTKTKIGGADDTCTDLVHRTPKMCVDEFKKNGVELVQRGKEDEKKESKKGAKGGKGGKGGKKATKDDDDDEPITKSRKKNKDDDGDDKPTARTKKTSLDDDDEKPAKGRKKSVEEPEDEETTIRKADSRLAGVKKAPTDDDDTTPVKRSSPSKAKNIN